MSRTELEDGADGPRRKLAGLRARHSALSSRLASIVETDHASPPQAEATVHAIRAEHPAIQTGDDAQALPDALPVWAPHRQAEILVASTYRLPRPVWSARKPAQASGRRISTSSPSRIAV